MVQDHFQASFTMTIWCPIYIYDGTLTVHAAACTDHGAVSTDNAVCIVYRIVYLLIDSASVWFWMDFNRIWMTLYFV